MPHSDATIASRIESLKDEVTRLPIKSSLTDLKLEILHELCVERDRRTGVSP